MVVSVVVMVVVVGVLVVVVEVDIIVVDDKVVVVEVTEEVVVVVEVNSCLEFPKQSQSSGTESTRGLKRVFCKLFPIGVQEPGQEPPFSYLKMEASLKK